MKLRILGDSLRFRLARSEVAALARGERVENTTHFPGGARLVYSLSTGAVPAVAATFDDRRIDVVLPHERINAWAESAEVSIRDTQRLPEGALRLLIEKDFECMQPREGEDPADRYPNPKKRGM
jgi:hypothetical protein